MNPVLPLSISADRRVNHAAFVHRGRVLVYGGVYWDGVIDLTVDFEEDLDNVYPRDEILIYDPADLSWTTFKTRGEDNDDDNIPNPRYYNYLTDVHQAVIGDRLFLFWSHRHGEVDMKIHVLDLDRFVWKRIPPSGGERKPRGTYGATCFVRGEDVVFIGGRNGNSIPGVDPLYEGLRVYSSKDNAWSWPAQTGEVPSGCFLVGSCGVGNRAYVQSERLEFTHPLRLLRLDMDEWRWERMRTPGDIACHSMTPLLEEGKEEETVEVLVYQADKAWMLRLNDDVGGVFTRREHLDRRRGFGQRAVIVPGTGQVWLIGGHQYDDPDRRIAKLDVMRKSRPSSLLHLSLEAVRKEKERLTEERIKEELPKNLLVMLRDLEESEM